MPGPQPQEFVANPNAYHKYTAHVLAKLSGYMYNFKNKAELLKKAQEHVRFNSVSTFGPNGNEAVVLENQECAVVVWRGSATMRDWQDNLTIGVTPYEIKGVQGNIWKGFWNHTDSEWKKDAADGVSAKLQELTEGTNRKVFFTGHSLGGACAVVSACRFIEEQNGLSKLAQIVTMGQPRTVDAKIADFLSTKLKNKYFRFVICGDSVPRFPTELSHGGVLKFITSEPAIYTNPHLGIIFVHTALFRRQFVVKDGASYRSTLALIVLDGTPAGTIIYHNIRLYSKRILLPEKETLWNRLMNDNEKSYTQEQHLCDRILQYAEVI